ncbi:MAG: 3-methyl-2-oxobutanoate hydroxymethyltransferase [Betaproteobacteria bacterium TMED82]|nr:MAG: 3-methyl-2-oxobutanoate hydroxymethyltransferase [Betaproteobacteria bacterium TMED82]|tara:strand:- start:1939 stop:2706 length:768 start_codon:yes stop_codon:yes gene_type:complete
MELNDLKEKSSKGEKIVALTCYDFTFASLIDKCGVDITLVGDSLGMVIKGYDTTLSVTIEEMIYHTRCVASGIKNSIVMADLPFSTYQESPEKAYSNASKLLEAGAKIIKLEGNAWIKKTINFLSSRDIPVCSHIGMLPQSLHKIGGYKVQGDSPEEASRLLKLSLELEREGADVLVLELVTKSLAKEITTSVKIPTIGIGSGPSTNGQVLVLYDILGLDSKVKPRFVKNFMRGNDSIKKCIEAYALSVRSGIYP